jgi:Transposase, Mutator family
VTTEVITLPDGRRLCWHEFGDPDGPPAIYTAGTPVSGLGGAAYDHSARAAGLRWIPPDKPGYGGSDYQPNRSLLSWADDLAALAVGDGALGFWNGLREVFPQTAEGRCWFHKTANVLAALPKSAQPGAKKALAEIWNAEDKDHARTAVKAFHAAYGTKHPKATAKITDDQDELLAFYDYPADHWIHLRTTNPIESTFATVRHRSKITKGPGSQAAGLAMAFKLIESAQDRWRAVNAPHLVALVRAGATFRNGVLVERAEPGKEAA